jgi:hypothetical protein
MTLTDLREQTSVELASLDGVNATLLTIVQQCEGRKATDIERAAVFSLLIQLYSGFEHIFKRICKFYHVPIPTGDDSHQRLMSRFIASQAEREYPVLPILIPESLRTPLTTLRRFRHAAIHGYSHRFDEERLMIAATETPALYATFKSEVENFLSTLPPE